MTTYNTRDWIRRIAVALIDAKGATDNGWLTHLAQVAGAVFEDAGIPAGTIVAARDGTIVTHDGFDPRIGHARAGLHTVIWHVGCPRFLVCAGCGVGNSLLLQAEPQHEREAWALHCDACAAATRARQAEPRAA